MLSAKPWRFEAVARLILGVFVCMYAGSLVLTALRFHSVTHRNLAWFYLALAVSLALLGTTLHLIRGSWPIAGLPRRLAAVLLCFYSGLLLGTWVQKLAGGSAGPSVVQMIVAALSFQGASLVLVARFVREHGTNWSGAFGFRNRWRQALLLGFIVACLFVPIGWMLQWVSAKMMDHWPGLHPQEQQAVQTLHMASTWLPRVVLGIITILVAPVAEEILFRGILYTWVKQLGFPRLALWGTALFFAAVHQNLVTFVPLTILALALALLYERTDNLLAPITAHAIFNGMNFTVLYLFPDPISRMS